jgi:uncharacterized protein (DUF1800 family)
MAHVQCEGMKRLAAVVLLLLPFGLAGAGGKKIKKVKPSDNPVEYRAFSQPLSDEDRLHHALDRLTFGARPGDGEQLRQSGLDKWIEGQLHPERVAENPLLAERLAPLESLRLNSHDIYTHYPPPQAIAAVARGKGTLPDDPELRAIVVRLADRYLQKKQVAPREPGAPPATARGALNSPDEDTDLDLRVRIEDILTPAEIATLRNGKPDDKRRVLEGIPASKRLDFTWALRPVQRRQLFTFAPVELRRELMLSVNPAAVVASDLSEGKLLRAIYSTHQLQELLIDFWFNHFNVFLNKGAGRYQVPSYEREAIRPHVFGKFHDLLLATAKSPAMLFYLDNWQSAGPPENERPNTRLRRQRGLNENYGRELLELHTLGVEGGYTQKDVIEVARCFTGWTIAAPRQGGAFEYNDKMHDHGQKVVLGHVIRAGGGMSDGLKVIEILARHPSTAHFISLRLAQRFVSDNPPPSLVNRMAKTFRKSDGDLRKVMETMLYSGEFWSAAAYRAKVKSPFEMVVSAVRATNADVTSAYLLSSEMRRLGEPLYGKLEPTGYSAANAEWVSSASLLDRMNFALALANNRVPGVKMDTAAWEAVAQKDPLALARQLLDRDPSEQTRAAIEKSVSEARPRQIPSLVAGLTLGSPEFQKR